MPSYYNIHLTKTTDPTPIPKTKLERGMVIKIKYKKDNQLKQYLVFVLQPKWPNTDEGKLHGLSLDAIPPDKLLKIAEIYDEVLSNSKKVRKLDLAKIKINESSKLFYTSEIKKEKQLKNGYRTFNLMDIKSIQAVNYNWGKYDIIAPSAERRKQSEDERRKQSDERRKQGEETARESLRKLNEVIQIKYKNE